MIARTHDLAAVTALGIVYIYSSQPTLTLSTLIIAVFANLIGGVAPDIDQPTAPLWRNLPVGKLFGRTFGMLAGGHRFLTHSLVGLALLGFLAHWLLVFLKPILGATDINIVWWAFMIGMASHLIMDTLTKEGVPWLLPVPIKFGFPPLKAWRITTGKWAEAWLVFPLLLAVNVWLYLHNHQQVLHILHYKII